MDKNVYFIDGFHHYETIYGAYSEDNSEDKVLIVEESISKIFIDQNPGRNILTFRFGNIYNDTVKFMIKNFYKKRIKIKLFTNSLMGWGLFYVCMQFRVVEVYYVNKFQKYPLIKVKKLMEEIVFISMFWIFFGTRFTVYKWGSYRTYGISHGKFVSMPEKTLDKIDHDFKYIFLDFNPSSYGIDIDKSVAKIMNFLNGLENIAIKPHPQYDDGNYFVNLLPYPILDMNTPAEIYLNNNVTIIFLNSSTVAKSSRSLNLFHLLHFDDSSRKGAALRSIREMISYYKVHDKVFFLR